MMTCSKCRKTFENEAPRCPYCGERNPTASGLFQTSTVLISAEGSDQVYRSVEDVPSPLRNRLLKSTNSANSATILIADRKGRHEIDKAMRKLAGSAQRRLPGSALGAGAAAEGPGWLTQSRKRWLAILLALLALAVVALVFLHRWK